ncbi:unnamed protein product [Arabidopsis lyrata]|uniref:Predicted protein n=1 Tax=Arabidopsis lyrata subsp. lyrata TaxID=81972 RepID=D7M7D9_ARALL|nr:uncharacterized protein LOC9309801 [Arabidopsis lyrata subsp. lyrata]EFH47929.1 predicted protein [Arabidopsis lyrata subsp. lyrata]CAH8271194.1 unnamed protein product [Arabidopsis lyrata]|eukprot:XP_002871670.1 uncharacterized protein LOC9309801 [Arabidopsis lyrata subsp. lyrata]
MDETQKTIKLVNHTERNPVLSPFSVKNDNESNIEEMIKLNCKEQDISNVIKSKQEEKATVEDDDDDVKEIIQDDISICCRSEASNNSISSFTFPILHNEEDGSVTMPSLETIWNVYDNQLFSELSQPPKQPQGPQPQQQFYFIPSTQTLPQLPPQKKSLLSKQTSETQSQKVFINRWFSCFNFIIHFDVIDSRSRRRKKRKD